MWVPPPVVNAIHNIAVNPEAAVRGVVNFAGQAEKTMDVFNRFNNDMHRRAQQGDLAAHAYMYPAPPGVPPMPPLPQNPRIHVEYIAPRKMTNVHTGEELVIVGIVRPNVRFLGR